MTDAEKELIDAVILWQKYGANTDRKRNTQAIRDAADKIVIERLPDRYLDRFVTFIGCQERLPREDFTHYEWEDIYSDAYADFKFLAYGDPKYGRESHYYRDLDPSEKQCFLDYFEAKRALTDLCLPVHLFDRFYEEAKSVRQFVSEYAP